MLATLIVTSVFLGKGRGYLTEKQDGTRYRDDSQEERIQEGSWKEKGQKGMGELQDVVEKDTGLH